jgi:ABC-2 type transport system permease protein
VMKPFLALLRKHLHDTRGTLLLSGASLFALGWLFVFFTSLNETQILEALASNSEENRFQWLRNLGLEEQPPSVSIMMTFWNHPFIILFIAIWAISRGSIAVGAEVERGTLDLILSRPVSRMAYLLSHVVVGVLGLGFLTIPLAAGARAGVHFNYLRVPPSFWTLIQPALNLAALGLPIYGCTLLISAVDQVRCRPMMIGSVLTLASFIVWFIARIPVLHKYSWRVYLEAISIFKLYNPVDAVSAREFLSFNLAVLAAIAAGCIVLAFVGFARRDLPANG